MLPRWDPRLKDPESVAFTILDVLADLESEGKLKNLPKSKKIPSKNNNSSTPLQTILQPTPQRRTALRQKTLRSKHPLLNPPQLGEKTEPRRINKPPPEKTSGITLRWHSSRLNNLHK